MATIRHGGGSHFMRPDRVYRTSVLSPMVGYQPQRDVNEVAMLFTQGPARGMMLDGLGAMPGPIQRFWLRLKAAIAQRKAAKFMTAATLPANNTGIVPVSMSPQIAGLGMPGPAPAYAQHISPLLSEQMAGAMALMQRRYGTGYPAQAADALARRPLNWWY